MARGTDGLLGGRRAPEAGAVRVLHLADLHVSDDERVADQRVVLQGIVSLAAERRPDLIVVAGDLTNHQPRRATPAERNLIVEHFKALADVAPVAVVRGNHDVPGDWLFVSRLRAAHPVVYAEAPMVWRPDDAARFDVVLLPYPERAALAGQVRGRREAVNDAVRQGLTLILRRLAEAMRPGVAAIGVAHCNVIGSKADNDQPLIGDEVELSAGELAETGVSLWCLGHIHKPQEVAPGLVYSGAPMFHRFPRWTGSVEQRGCYLHAVDAAGVVASEFVPLPHRRFVTVGLWWGVPGEAEGAAPELLGMDRTGEIGGPAKWITGKGKAPVEAKEAEVRVRVQYQEAHGATLDRDGIVERLLSLGAARVKLEATAVVSTKVRAPEITEAATLQEKVQAWLHERGQEPQDEAMAGQLWDSLAALETKEPDAVVEAVRANLEVAP